MLAAAAERTKTIRLSTRGDGAELGRSGAGLSSSSPRSISCPAGAPRSWPGAARSSNPFRCSATTSTTTTRCSPRSSNCCCRSATTSASPGRASTARRCNDQRRLSAHAEQDPDLGRGRRQSAIGDPRRLARPADGARHHRRPAGALRAVRRSVPPGRAARPATTPTSCRSASTPMATSPRPRSRRPTSSSRAMPRR